MKTIIQRNLPLDQEYALIDKKYIPLEHGVGTCCANCGQIIANIAVVLGEDQKSYDIGFDCLETLLINNNLLHENDIEAYHKVKATIPKILRFAKHVKSVLAENSKKIESYRVTGLRFEKVGYETNHYPFYWLTGGRDTSRDNDYVKMKDVEFDFVVTSLKNIFPKLTIIYE